MRCDAVRTRLSLGLFLLVLISYGYFVQGGGAGQNSRFNLTRAIVENGSFRIDPYHSNTFDKAKVGDHWYTDKAPGFSFATVPIHWVLHRLGILVPVPGPSPGALHIATLGTVGLATATAAMMGLWFLTALGISSFWALVSILAWLFGTNAFGYGTLFMSHQFAAALLFISLSLVGKERRIPYFISGMAAGWAVISEHPAAIGALGILVVGAIRRPHTVSYFALGGLVPAVLAATYNAICFGSPWAIGYQSLATVHFAEEMDKGFFGIGVPRGSVLLELLIGEYRGLLFLSPFLLLVPIGFLTMIRAHEHRLLGAVLAFVCCGFLLIVSGYFQWDGGASMGPRHLVPMLPFALIPTGFALQGIHDLPMWARSIARPASVALLILSVTVCTATVAVMPELPDVRFPGAPARELRPPDMSRPIRTFVFPMLLSGHVSEKSASSSGKLGFSSSQVGHERDAYNLGERLGLKGATSLVPLVLLWGAFVLWVARQREGVHAERE